LNKLDPQTNQQLVFVPILPSGATSESLGWSWVSERLQTSISSVGSRNSLFGPIPPQPIQTVNNAKPVPPNRFKTPINYNFIGENSLHILKENFFKKSKSIASAYHEFKINTNINKLNVKSIKISKKLSSKDLNSKNIKSDNNSLKAKHVTYSSESKVLNIESGNELKLNENK